MMRRISVGVVLLRTGVRGVDTGRRGVGRNAAHHHAGRRLTEEPVHHGFDLGLVGYQESELFVSGTASATSRQRAHDRRQVDGRRRIATAPYTTRAVVSGADRSGQVQRHRHTSSG